MAISLSPSETTLLRLALGNRYHGLSYNGRQEVYIDTDDNSTKGINNTISIAHTPLAGYQNVTPDGSSTENKWGIYISHLSSSVGSQAVLPHNYNLNVVSGQVMYVWTFYVPNTVSSSVISSWLNKLARNKNYIYNSAEWPFNKNYPTPHHRFPPQNIIRGLNDFSQSEYQY